jgi:hypothetical protein
MSADATLASERSPASELVTAVRTADRYRTAIALIIVAQAIWLGTLAAQGWYYQADFSNLAQATGRSVSWSYLRLSQGGHLSILDRAVFWVLNRVAPLNYPVTIGLRLVAQAASTYFLAKLLLLIVGRRRGVLVVLGLYAFSPLLIQGTLWLTASIALLGSQLFLLLALHGHVRYAMTRDLRWAVAAAGGIFGATLFSEQAAVTALILPILSLGFLHAGSIRQRFRATVSCWREWTMIAAPLIAFLAYFFAIGNYGDAAKGIGAFDAIKLVVVEWTASIAPGLVGGPWVWRGTGDNYLGLANPSLPLRIVCVLVVAAVVAAGVRRTGRLALAAWSMPLLTSCIGILVVGVGRYETLGLLIAKLFEHAYFTALPAAIAVTLSLWRVSPERIRQRLAGGDASDEPAAPLDRRQFMPPGATRLISATLVIVVAAGSVMSGVTYTRRWEQSPARAYVTHLLSDLKHAGKNVALYDTAVNQVVIPGIVPDHYVSDVLKLAHADASTDVVQGSSPVVVGQDGRLRRAAFFRIARAVGARSPYCSQLVQGVGTWRLDLDAELGVGRYYVRLSFFQQRISTLNFSVLDADGRGVTPVAGQRTDVAVRVGSIALRLPSTAPRAIIVSSHSAATNICLVKAEVGFAYELATR